MGDIKMLFEFDEEKILFEKKYTIQQIKECILKWYERCGCQAKWEGSELIILSGKHIYDTMLGITGGLSRSDWFFPYIKRWEWIDADGVDNIIENYKELALKKPEREDLRKWLEK